MPRCSLSRWRKLHRNLWTLLAFLAGGSLSTARADLLEYVNKKDGAFSWKMTSKQELPQVIVYELHLISQSWQGIPWEHAIQVFVPKNVPQSGSMFLWNQGGKPGVDSLAFGIDMACKIKAPVALLFGIPNQPLLDGKREDALIAETFVRYLKTGDGAWPLLFPMVKSLVRAMDALQEFARQELKIEIRRFIVSGGSKRGWTTWLTGAIDARVQAIAPLVIDTLNFQRQLPHQLKSFGHYSDMIRDYTQRGLVPMPDTPEAKKLWLMVDPWHYRERLTMPTMIINGANDPYWSTDATNLYWDDLKAPKWLLYVPNAGHDLGQRSADGKKDRTRALGTLAAFAQLQAAKKELPSLTWKHEDVAGKASLTVQVSPVAPKAARLWVAQAPTRDFRKAQWQEHPATIDQLTVRGAVAAPSEGCQAFFAELEFETEGLRYFLSTQMRITGQSQRGP
jgi:PhoPQ-activated pathogenicity-related protein